jgi:hypothetical protein
VNAHDELVLALSALVTWLDESNLSRTQGVGVGAFRTEPVEYEVITAARAALAKAEGRS